MRALFAVAISILSNLALAAPADAPVRACVQDLCGGKANLLTMAGGGALTENVPQETREIIKSLSPALNEILETDRLLAAMNEKLFANAAAVLDPAVLSDEQKSFVGMLTLAALGDKADGQPATVREWHSKTLKLLNDSFYANTADAIAGRPFEMMVKTFGWTEEDFQKNIGQWVTAAEEIRRLADPYYISDSALAVIKKAAAGATLTELDKKILVQNAVMILRFAMFQDEEIKKQLHANPLPLADLIKLLRPKVAKFSELIASPKKMGQLRKRLAETCSKNISARIEASIPNADQGRAQNSIEQVRTAALAVLPKYFRGSELEQTRMKIRNAQFLLPSSREASITQVVDYFKDTASDVADLRKGIALPNIESEMKLRFIRFLITLATMPDEEGTAEAAFDLSSELCGQMGLPELLDAAHTPSGAIVVGWQSLRHIDYGRGIVAHELGHIAHRATENFRSGRAGQCMIAQHKRFYGKTSADGATKELEDWADVFSTSVLRELRKTLPDTKNFGCALISMNVDEGDFQNGALDLAYNPAGTHSSGLFRLLNVQAGLGPLPASCLKVPGLAARLPVTCTAGRR